jgi:hypothetical protein
MEYQKFVDRTINAYANCGKQFHASLPGSVFHCLEKHQIMIRFPHQLRKTSTSPIRKC